MIQKNKILIISHLYLFPKSILIRGGIDIHESLVNMLQTGKKIEVVYFLPFIWRYIKFFKFNWKKFTFEPYEIDGIFIYPVFYIPRLSKIISKLDKRLKIIAFNFFYIRPFLKDNNVCLLYGQTLYPDGPLLPKISEILKAPFIVILRGSDVHTLSANNSNIHMQSLNVLNKADLVMSVGKKLRDVSVEVFGRDFVKHILYTSSKLEIFRNTKPIDSRLKKIVYVGALVEAKGIYELINAFSKITKGDNEYLLTLVGDGCDRNRLIKLIEEMGIKEQVIFKGNIDDRELLALEINKADIFLFPSHNEGLPNAVIEAVACERVVICTEVGGVKEIAEPNLAFRLISPKNIDAIVEVVQELKKTDIEELKYYAGKNRAKLIEKFSQKSELKSFNEILKQLNID